MQVKKRKQAKKSTASSAFKDGYTHGRQAGYEQGYHNGLIAGEQQNILPVALIIAPISTFPSLEIIVLQPFRWLKDQGIYNFRLVVEDEATVDDIAAASIVIFVRNVAAKAAELFQAAHELGKKTVYVIDDNFLEISEGNASTAYYKDPVHRETCLKFLTQSSVVQVHSKYFADLIRLQYNSRVVCFVASVDFHLLEETGPKPVRDDGITVFGYEGTNKEEDFAVVVPAIRQILQEYGARVRVEFMGFVPAALQGLPGVVYYPLDYDYRHFMQTLYQTTWDFGLAPLAHSPFNLCKTNNKFREYAACAIPGIYTETPAYTDWVDNEVTGLLVPHTTEAWYAGMKRMIEEPQLREAIKTHAYDYCRTHFSIEQTAAQWRQHILQV